MPATAERCPTCGAPLKLDARQACAFCHTPLKIVDDPAAPVAVRAAEAEPVDPNGPFAMLIEDVFSITGRGTVLTGKVASGTITTGDKLVLDDGRTVKCKGIERFRKVTKTASAGEFVGLMIDGQGKAPVVRGGWVRAAG